MLPELAWKLSVGIGDVVSSLSAIAAAVAAYAAWQSTLISKQAAEQSRSHTRLQVYIMHRDQFNKVLDQMESDMGIVFFNRDNLYDDLYPDNKDLDLVFSFKVQQDHISSWSASYSQLANDADLLSVSEADLATRELAKWAMEYLILSGNYLRYRVINGMAHQLYIDDEIPTGIAEEWAHDYLYKMHKVLNCLLSFGCSEESVAYKTPNDNLRLALKSLKTLIAMGWARHTFKP